MSKAYSPNTMLDSGAFSAWYHKDTIEIKDYMAFIEQHGPRFCSIVALDKIPGEKMQMAKTPAAIEAAAKESHKNFEIMRKAGIDCIPVFHMGEDFKWLERMLDDRVPYIGISPYMKAGTDSILVWMDECFTRLSDNEGRPLCKTHGFGVTTHQVIQRYPWYSVDSTSWALAAGYGKVMMPRVLSGGKLDFVHPVRFSMTEREAAGFNNMVNIGPAGRKAADEYFKSIGFSFTEVRNFQQARLAVNASFFMGLEKQLPGGPFRYRKGPNSRKVRPYSEHAAAFDYRPRVILATMVKIQQQGVVLTNLRAPNRLISYYDARRFEPEQIEEYTTNGFCGRGRYKYRRGTKSHSLRRSMLFLKRLEMQKETDE